MSDQTHEPLPDPYINSDPYTESTTMACKIERQATEIERLQARIVELEAKLNRISLIQAGFAAEPREVRSE